MVDGGDAFDEVRAIRGRAPGDQYSSLLSDSTDMVLHAPNPLDSEEARNELHRLLGWFYLERDIQASNRLEMALDADYYDGMQWKEEDAAIVKDRGQLPLVYNEVAALCDWLIGTERRMRVDWKVLPRTEDDVQMADIKTKALKYVSDVNHVPFVRSRAFADAVKVGVGWIDDGVRDDPTKDPLYSKWEDWRCVIWDSAGYEPDLSDARYVFRWRWVDEDIACLMYPERADKIRQAARNMWAFSLSDDDTWYLGAKLDTTNGRLTAGGVGMAVDVQRRRVRLIEAQYRTPIRAQVVADGPMKGAFYHPKDTVLNQAMGSASIIDRITNRVHFAVFVEGAMLEMGVSPYRHNNFTLTPIWCYRKSRDRLPYGMIRRVRDIQDDLNKRASKASFLFNTNQVFADKGAVDDVNVAMDEVARPDGYIETNPGKRFEVRRDSEAASGQIQLLTLAAQSIQKITGVNNENLGRQTNATSGEAIKARQNQGSVATTEPFDNQLLSIQIQGEKQLSMVEQFYTEPKVIRLTGAKGKLDWVKVNTPEIQPDGSVRYLNDITASMADFVVSEQDYSGTLRQVMFESLQNIVLKLPPEIGLRLFTIAMRYSDLPNADEIVQELRKVTGEPDPNHEPTPEEQQKMAQQQQMQAEALQIQREDALLALDERRAKIKQMLADAESKLAGNPNHDDAILQIRAEANRQIEALTNKLTQAQADFATQIREIRQDADRTIEVARINADAKIRVAEIAKVSDDQLALLQERIDAVAFKDQPGSAQDSPEAGAGQAQGNAGKEQGGSKGAPEIHVHLPEGLVKQGDTHLHLPPQPAGKKTVTLNTGDKTVTGTIEHSQAQDAPAAPAQNMNQGGTE